MDSKLNTLARALFPPQETTLADIGQQFKALHSAKTRAGCTNTLIDGHPDTGTFIVSTITPETSHYKTMWMVKDSNDAGTYTVKRWEMHITANNPRDTEVRNEQTLQMTAADILVDALKEIKGFMIVADRERFAAELARPQTAAPAVAAPAIAG